MFKEIKVLDVSDVSKGSVCEARGKPSLVPVEVTKSGAVPFSLKYTPWFPLMSSAVMP